eukprot:UN32080
MSWHSKCGKIIGVGRNYMAHIKELNNTVPDVPLLFLKPTSSIVSEGSPIILPKGCLNSHHEVELGVVIGKRGKNIKSTKAMNYIKGYCLALDMTARDFQDIAKKKGLPWLMAKGWDTACPLSDFIEKRKVKQIEDLQLTLSVNGSLKQDGSTNKMIHTVPYLIEYISRYFTLEENDLLLTGTPDGVGPVGNGDVIECALKQGKESLAKMKFHVKEPGIDLELGSA